MTAAELQTQRDKILTQMSAPQTLTAGDMGLTNRGQRDLRDALASIDAELARLQGGTVRTFTIQSERGI
jgi:hypothetical protein